METTRIKFYVLLLITIGTGFLVSGCMEPELESTWRNREITIDGKNAEWAGCEVYYDEENGIKIGIINDELNVYLCIYTWNRKTQMQILMRGLTVWFDPEGGKKEVFGVHYPLKKTGMNMDRSAFQRGSERNDPEMINMMLVGSRNELEILGPEEGVRLSKFADDIGELGMEATIDIYNRILVYELKVPLTGSDERRYAIGPEPGARVGIGFKVGKMDIPGREGFRGRGGSPGGGMDRPPGGRGMPGGRGGMGGPPSFESFDLWAKVQLAVESSETQEK